MLIDIDYERLGINIGDLMIGTTEIIIIIAIILILFGPKKLPQLARAIGQSVRDYRDGVSETPKSAKKVKRS